MKNHGDIEKVEIVDLNEDEPHVVRVIYWFRSGDDVLRHTSYYDPGNETAAKHLVELLTLSSENSDLLDAISDAYYEMAFAVGDLAGHQEQVIERHAGKLAKCADRLKPFVPASGRQKP